MRREEEWSLICVSSPYSGIATALAAAVAVWVWAAADGKQVLRSLVARVPWGLH